MNMEQFSLEKYLENKSRKVVTRRGNPVRIICTDRKHGEDELPIVFLEEIFNGEFLLACTKDGRGDYHYDSQYDLFFADEEEKPQSIEIPFGARDSEFIKDEYYIPEGCEARIEGNKVIIEKIQKEEELTELQKTLEEDCDCYVNLYNDGKTREELREWIKCWCHRIIDLVRKEILKDLPKLEKTKDVIDPTIPVMYTYAATNKSYVEYDGYKLCINDVFKKLPKEEL